MVDITKTRVQTINQAAVSLGLVQPGETLSSEDYNTLDNLYDPVIAQLSADRVIYIQDADAIDVAYFLPVAAILANFAGPNFGSPINDAAMMRDTTTLKRMTATDPLYTAQEGHYY